MRRSRFGCIAFAAVAGIVACGVDYEADQAKYDRIHCIRDPKSCETGGAAGFSFGGFGGSGGTGNVDSSTGATGGFGGFGGTGGSGGGVDGGDAGDTGPCLDGDKRCTGTNKELCVGSSWQSTPCTTPTPECELGECVLCANGNARCVAGAPEQCTGNTWVKLSPCTSSTICQNGSCLVPPSCTGLSANCGSTGTESCCTTLAAPGGPFLRNNSASYPATVSDTVIDKYEITVGRFRKFVAAYPYTPPSGAAAHPKIPGSGWSSSFDSALPTSASALTTALKCGPFATWTDAVGANENDAINCLDWYTAFAFCAWDGGRLPTDLEWNYVAAGGGEQRVYPWGTTAPGNNTTLAVYGCLFVGGAACTVDDVAPVGSASGGDGRWFHADLAGNAEEWTLDYSGTLPTTCTDCANISSGSMRLLRGGAFNSGAATLVNSFNEPGDPTLESAGHGARCARTL